MMESLQGLLDEHALDYTKDFGLSQAQIEYRDNYNKYGAAAGDRTEQERIVALYQEGRDIRKLYSNYTKEFFLTNEFQMQEKSSFETWLTENGYDASIFYIMKSQPRCPAESNLTSKLKSLYQGAVLATCCDYDGVCYGDLTDGWCCGGKFYCTTDSPQKAKELGGELCKFNPNVYARNFTLLIMIASSVILLCCCCCIIRKCCSKRRKGVEPGSAQELQMAASKAGEYNTLKNFPSAESPSFVDKNGDPHASAGRLTGFTPSPMSSIQAQTKAKANIGNMPGLLSNMSNKIDPGNDRTSQVGSNLSTITQSESKEKAALLDRERWRTDSATSAGHPNGPTSDHLTRDNNSASTNNLEELILIDHTASK